MILNPSTTKWQITTSTTKTIDYLVEWADLATDFSTFASGTNQGTISTATDTDIVAAPSSGVVRQLKSLLLHNTDTASNNISFLRNVSGTQNTMLGPITLLAGEKIIWTPEQGFVVLDSQLRQKRTSVRMSPTPTLRVPPFHQAADLTGTKNLTNQVQIWGYAGRAKRGGVTSVQVRYRTTTAGTNKQVAQVGLAIGARYGVGGPNLGGPGVISPVGKLDTTSFDAVAGLKTDTVPVSSGYTIAEGDQLWIGFYSDMTGGTTTIVRSCDVGDDVIAGYGGNYQIASTGVPISAFIGSDIPLAVDSNSTQYPWFSFQET